MTKPQWRITKACGQCYVTVLFCLALWGVVGSASAHPADESGLLVRAKRHEVTVRLTFNILTLARFVKVDANGDGLIGISELDAAQPALAFYLTQHVPVEINRKPATLGADVTFDYLWPEARSTAPMTEPEFSSRNVDVTFKIATGSQLLEDVWIGFEFFEQTGPMHIIQGMFEKEADVTQVQFTAMQPEFLYDTGFAEDPFEKAAAPLTDNSNRIWLIRLAVLIALIVLGRVAALARRARKPPTRRGRRS